MWALGVGIVLVGDFMGWNLSFNAGGILAQLIGVCVISIMYISQVFMISEMCLCQPQLGGQYEIAKNIMGPLTAFNIAIMQILEYVMLEAGDVIVVGALVHFIFPTVSEIPITISVLLLLTFINYMGAKFTLSVNFIVTAIALSCIIALFFNVFLNDNNVNNYGTFLFKSNSAEFLDILSVLSVSCWFFLGVEGAVVIGKKCASPKRDIPLGILFSFITLFISSLMTLYICSNCLNMKEIASSIYPLYDAAKSYCESQFGILMFVATILACLASANGCISDAASVLASLSKDELIPSMFERKHIKHSSFYRALIVLFPIALAFGITGLLDQVVSFCIFSALMIYLLTNVMIFVHRKKLINKQQLVYKCPFYPFLPIISIIINVIAIIGLSVKYPINVCSAILFYIIISIWFTIFRNKKIVTTQNGRIPKK